MRLAIHDYPGHGFIAELSRALARRGHDVRHFSAAHNPTPKGILKRTPEDPQTLSFETISIDTFFKKYSLLIRRKQERQYGRLLVEKLRAFEPELVLSAQAPLDAQVFINRFCMVKSIPLVAWIQDLLGQATHLILSRRIPMAGNLIGRYYLWLERRLIAQAQAVVVLTSGFKEHLETWGLSGSDIHIIPNWPPIDRIPMLQRRNAWTQEYGLADQFVFLYTGTLGFKHDPALLLLLARHFQKNKGVSVVVVSQGPGASWLEEKKLKFGLPNLMILPFQPLENYAQVLAAGDVLVGILEPDAAGYSIPSKVLSYLCAGRPILLSIDPENLAARIVREEEAGLIARPRDTESFLTAAERLHRNAQLRETMGRNGRHYAEQAFDINRIALRFEEILAEALDDSKARGTPIEP